MNENRKESFSFEDSRIKSSRKWLLICKEIIIFSQYIWKPHLSSHNRILSLLSRVIAQKLSLVSDSFHWTLNIWEQDQKQNNCINKSTCVLSLFKIIIFIGNSTDKLILERRNNVERQLRYWWCVLTGVGSRTKHDDYWYLPQLDQPIRITTLNF